MVEHSSLHMERSGHEETYAASDLKPWPEYASNIIQAFLFAQKKPLLTGTTAYLRGLRILEGAEPDPKSAPPEAG
jgi:hypothetical protein